MLFIGSGVKVIHELFDYFISMVFVTIFVKLSSLDLFILNIPSEFLKFGYSAFIKTFEEIASKYFFFLLFEIITVMMEMHLFAHWEEWNHCLFYLPN